MFNLFADCGFSFMLDCLITKDTEQYSAPPLSEDLWTLLIKLELQSIHGIWRKRRNCVLVKISAFLLMWVFLFLQFLFLKKVMKKLKKVKNLIHEF